METLKEIINDIPEHTSIMKVESIAIIMVREDGSLTVLRRGISKEDLYEIILPTLIKEPIS